MANILSRYHLEMQDPQLPDAASLEHEFPDLFSQCQDFFSAHLTRKLIAEQKSRMKAQEQSVRVIEHLSQTIQFVQREKRLEEQSLLNQTSKHSVLSLRSPLPELPMNIVSHE